MRFRFDQHIAAPPERVLGALTDPDYYVALGELPGADVGSVEPAEHRGDSVLIRVRYRFRGELPGAARRFLDPAKLTWVIVTDFDTDRARASFTVLPDHYPDWLSCSGDYRLTPVDGGTRREVTGELRVHVPVVGGPVERALVSGLEDRLRAESDALASWTGHSDPSTS